MNPLKVSALVLSLGVAGLASANAALVINDSNIAANSYQYSMSFADLATSTKFTNDTLAVSGVSLFSDGVGAGERRYIRATPGGTSASFTYAFDFTATSYRPVSMSVLDYVLVDTQAAGALGATLVATTEYSFDNTTWTTIRTRTSTTSSQTSTGTTNITFPEAQDVVYYRTTFTMSGINPNTSLPHVFSGNGAQWDRMGPADATRFVATFAVEAAAVPEPSSFALCAGGLGLGAAALRRRRSAR